MNLKERAVHCHSVIPPHIVWLIHPSAWQTGIRGSNGIISLSGSLGQTRQNTGAIVAAYPQLFYQLVPVGSFPSNLVHCQIDLLRRYTRNQSKRS